MAKEKTALLLIKKEWVNTAAFMLNEGRPSASLTETHLLIAPFDCTDQHGVWVKEIVSHQLTKDRSAVTMKVFVPWSVVLTLGIVDEEYAKVQMGFAALTANAP